MAEQTQLLLHALVFFILFLQMSTSHKEMKTQRFEARTLATLSEIHRVLPQSPKQNILTVPQTTPQPILSVSFLLDKQAHLWKTFGTRLVYRALYADSSALRV